MRPEGMHVTLKFIGHAIPTGDVEKLDAVRAALATVRSDQPVEMSFRGVGFFPHASRPRVIWCGVQGSNNLAPLAADIETVARAARDFRRRPRFPASSDAGAFQAGALGQG